jgi:hypothetical protein
VTPAARSKGAPTPQSPVRGPLLSGYFFNSPNYIKGF